MTPRPRPKVKAAGQSSVGVVVLAFGLRLCGVDVNDVPPEVLLAVAGGLATITAYIKRDGLSGTWTRIVSGDDVS